MKNIALITGISGQDGSLLAESLLEKGYEVHGFVRRAAIESSDDKLRNIQNIKEKVTLHTGSIENHLSIYKVIASVQPAELYHLAAASFVSYNFDDENSIINQNFNPTHYILSSIKETSPKTRFFLAGSSEMFGDVQISPQDEQTPLNPRSLYGIAKTASHSLVKNYRAQYGIYACTGFFYNHESPRRGMQFVTRKIAHACARIKLGLQAKITLGNLDAKRDWGYAPDYVEGMWQMMQQSQPLDYVMATGKLHSVREFAEIAFARAGLNLESHLQVDESFFRPSEKVSLCGDSRKIQAELGWKHTRSLEEVIFEMVDAEIKSLQKMHL